MIHKRARSRFVPSLKRLISSRTSHPISRTRRIECGTTSRNRRHRSPARGLRFDLLTWRSINSSTLVLHKSFDPWRDGGEDYYESDGIAKSRQGLGGWGSTDS